MFFKANLHDLENCRWRINREVVLCSYYSNHSYPSSTESFTKGTASKDVWKRFAAIKSGLLSPTEVNVFVLVYRTMILTKKVSISVKAGDLVH